MLVNKEESREFFPSTTNLVKKKRRHKLVFSILTLLFITASTVGAFFLVKTSQDNRQQAVYFDPNQPACVQEGGQWTANTPCCEGLVKATTPYGYYCSKPGNCTVGETKCQLDGNTYFQYTCDESGYFQRNKRCDFGCDGQVCKTGVCTPGETRCGSTYTLEICSSDGGAWQQQSCGTDQYCDVRTSSCISSNKLTPTATPTPSIVSCQDNGGDCIYNSSCGVVNRYPIDGTCPPPAVCCGGPGKYKCRFQGL